MPRGVPVRFAPVEASHHVRVLQGHRYVIGGMSRLTARVATGLAARHAEVIVLGDPDADADSREVAALIGDVVTLGSAGYDRDDALSRAGLGRADGFLALADDDLDNLRWVTSSHEVAPEVPVVLRMSRPELADQVRVELTIRRAYSVSAIAAPSFVAAAAGEEVIETLRLGDVEVPLCVVDVRESSPLAGITADKAKAVTDCAVVAVLRRGSVWQPAAGVDGVLQPGDRALIGGRELDVLALALSNTPDTSPGRAAPAPHRRRQPSARRLRASLLPVTAAVFLVLYAASVIVDYVVYGYGLADSLTFALGAALGNTPPATDTQWVKWFNLAALVAGVALLWVLLSHITALVLAERLEVRMTKRARRLRDHVVIIGLGGIGYRVLGLLAELRVPAAVIESAPDSGYIEAAAELAPVLTGDGRLHENLIRAGADRAWCIIACTDDDLVNLAASIEARRMNPSIRTVTRAFDDVLANRLRKAFGVDAMLSSTQIAGSAFVGAAIDELAMRPIGLDGLDLIAFRFVPTREIEPSALAPWREAGIRVVAVQHDGIVEPPTSALARPLRAGDEAIIVGPAELVRRFAGEIT